MLVAQRRSFAVIRETNRFQLVDILVQEFAALHQAA